jgi:hypothetical protein
VKDRDYLAKHSPLMRARRLEGAFPIEDAIALLDDLTTLDTRNDRRRKYLSYAMKGSGVLALVCLFAGLAPLIALFVVAVVVLLIFYYRLNRIDLPNDVLELCRAWLRILAADMAPQQSIALKLDFNPATSKAHRVYDQKVKGVRCLEYVHPWYTAETQLADGARLHCDATTRVRERVVTKHSRSGKTKTKRKYKYWTKLDVALGLPNDSFTVAKAAPGGPEKIRTKAGEKRNVVRVSRVLTSLSAAPPKLDDLIQPVALAYRQAAPAAPEQSA